MPLPEIPLSKELDIVHIINPMSKFSGIYKHSVLIVK